MKVYELREKMNSLLQEFNKTNKATIEDVTIDYINMSTADSDYKEVDYKFEFKVL